MSTATATAADAGAAPPAKGKKKLILIAAAALLLLVVVAVAAVLLLKPKHAVDDEDAGVSASASAPAKALDPKHPPTYVPLEPFTVNLADKDADRYAQVAVTLELGDPAVAEAIKAFMPAVRNNILMVLAHKTAAEMMARDGKTQLADEIRRETARGLGIELPADDRAGADGTHAARKKPKNEAVAPPPVTNVYFSTFIVQ